MRNKAVLLSKRLHLVFPLKRSTLRGRMTISYVAVTLGAVLTLTLVAVMTRGALVAIFYTTPSSDSILAIQRQAQSYASVATLQSKGTTLDPRINFIPGQAHTIAFAYPNNQHQAVFAPYITGISPDPASVAIALLATPDSHVIASSYPTRYAAGTRVSVLSPVQTHAIEQALAGRASTGTEQVSTSTLGYAAEPVWNETHQIIGAIFLQAPTSSQESIVSGLWNGLLSAVTLLVFAAPVGVFFGWITARGIVRRMRHLALATSKFATGDYTQRVVEGRDDEIGQLERQFNQMAEQLVDNITQRQQLAEQNARLEERSRISRELHDAVSQDLFSLRMLADGLQQATLADASSDHLRSHVALLEQTTTNMIREMRALLLELRPTELEHLGLADALCKLARVYSARLGIDVTARVAPVQLDIAAEHALLRIAQEALANAARHSNATLVRLDLAREGNKISLTVADNGRGFSPDADAEGYGLGLRIMHERIEELRGSFDLTSASDKGTCITAVLPEEHIRD